MISIVSKRVVISSVVLAALLLVGCGSESINSNQLLGVRGEEDKKFDSIGNGFLLPVSLDGDFIVAADLSWLWTTSSRLALLNAADEDVKPVVADNMPLVGYESKPAKGYAVFSKQNQDYYVFNQIWAYKNPDSKLSLVTSIGEDCNIQYLKLSPDASLVVGEVMSKEESDKILHAMVAKSRGESYEYIASPEAWVVNLKSGDIAKLGKDRVPLAWSGSGDVLYLMSRTYCVDADYKVYAHNFRTDKTESLGKYPGIFNAYYSEKMESLVAASEKDGRVELAAVDENFKRKKEIALIDKTRSEPVLSPDGAHLAYIGSDGKLQLLSLVTGKITKLGNFRGNLLPAWYGNDKLLAGNSEGFFQVVNIKGRIIRDFEVDWEKAKIIK